MNIDQVLGMVFTSRGSWQPVFVWFTAALGALFAGTTAALLWSLRWRESHPTRRLLRRVGTWGASVAGLGLLLLFFRYQGALYLSSPLVLLGWVGLWLWWLGDALDYSLRVYPGERHRYREAERKAKWLPRRHR